MGILLPAGSSWPDEVEAWAGQWRDTAREVLKTEFIAAGALSLPDRLHATIMRFAVPDDIDASDAMTTSVDNARKAVAKHKEGGLGRTAQALTHWQGEAAEGFLTYLDQMQDAVGFMADLLTDQKAVVENYNALVKAMKEDFKEAMTKGSEALAAASLAEEKTKLHVGTAITSVLAASSGPGVVSALFTGGAAVYLDWAGVRGKPEVVDAFATTMDHLYAATAQEMDRIEHAFEIIARNIAENTSLLHPNRPTLVTDKQFDPDTFSSRFRDAEPIEQGVSHRDLVAEPD